MNDDIDFARGSLSANWPKIGEILQSTAKAFCGTLIAAHSDAHETSHMWVNWNRRRASSWAETSRVLEAFNTFT
jgi:hypothetical protein